MIVSNVRKCDRCGALYETNNEPILTIKKREFKDNGKIMSMREIDLCESCTNDILEALAKKMEKDLVSEYKYTVLE